MAENNIFTKDGKNQRINFMSYNKKLFEEVYSKCIDIIKRRSEIPQRQLKKIKDSYNIVQGKNSAKIQEFHSITLEILVYDYLKNYLTDVLFTDDNCNPDLRDEINKLQIECYSATYGEDNSTENLMSNVANSLMNPYVYLERTIKGINQKKDQFEKYAITYCNVICLGVTFGIAALPTVDPHLHLLKVLYGKEVNSYELSGQFFKRIENNSEITKKDGKTFSTNYFNTDNYKNISSVLLINAPLGVELNKENVLLYINENANNKLNVDIFSSFATIIDKKFIENLTSYENTVVPQEAKNLKCTKLKLIGEPISFEGNIFETIEKG